MSKFFQIPFLLMLYLFNNLSFSQSDLPVSLTKDTINNSEEENLDVKIFRSINNLRNPFLDKIIYHTDISCIPVCLSTPLIIFTTSKINHNYYDESSAALLTLSELSTITTTFIVKELVKRERPFKKLKNVKHSKDDEMFLDPNSFPSGHSAISFCLATSLSLRYPDKPFLIAGLYTFSTLVAFGRIYIGVHYPTDVMAGILIGTGSALLMHSLRKEIIGNYDKNISNQKVNSDIAPGSFVFLSFALTEGVNYILAKNKINASSQLLFYGNEKFLNFSFSF